MGFIFQVIHPGQDPPLSSAEVKERVELYLYSPSGPSWPVLGRTLPLHPGQVMQNTKMNISDDNFQK
jgi:hypothetical protein